MRFRRFEIGERRTRTIFAFWPRAVSNPLGGPEWAWLERLEVTEMFEYAGHGRGWATLSSRPMSRR